MTLIEELANRLSSGADSILLSPELRPAEPRHVALVEAALQGNAPEHRPLVEAFDGGALVEILFLDGGRECLVAIAGQEGVLAAVVTEDQGEADSLYGGLAESIGILGEKCASCNAPIATVYEYCSECT